MAINRLLSFSEAFSNHSSVIFIAKSELNQTNLDQLGSLPTAGGFSRSDFPHHTREVLRSSRVISAAAAGKRSVATPASCSIYSALSVCSSSSGLAVVLEGHRVLADQEVHVNPALKGQPVGNHGQRHELQLVIVPIFLALSSGHHERHEACNDLLDRDFPTSAVDWIASSSAIIFWSLRSAVTMPSISGSSDRVR